MEILEHDTGVEKSQLGYLFTIDMTPFPLSQDLLHRIHRCIEGITGIEPRIFLPEFRRGTTPYFTVESDVDLPFSSWNTLYTEVRHTVLFPEISLLYPGQLSEFAWIEVIYSLVTDGSIKIEGYDAKSQRRFLELSFIFQQGNVKYPIDLACILLFSPDFVHEFVSYFGIVGNWIYDPLVVARFNHAITYAMNKYKKHFKRFIVLDLRKSDWVDDLGFHLGNFEKALEMELARRFCRISEGVRSGHLVEYN